MSTFAPKIDETHDPNLKSWVESANDPETDFPIQNLPFVEYAGTADGLDVVPRSGVRVGNQVLDLADIARSELLRVPNISRRADEFALGAFAVSALDRATRQTLRNEISRLLRSDVAELRDHRSLLARAMHAADEIAIGVPVVRNYTDFYASIHHASTVGAMFRPDNPLLPNYKWVPIGYHGRASSIVASGTEVRRPRGQTKADDAAAPEFGPCKMLDYELEVGCFIGLGNGLGGPISIADAREHIFGLCLVNDWSARDMQKWEYQPLGPFLAKNFATTVSPYVVTLEALEPFRCPAYKRPDGDPKPLGYLASEEDQALGGFDIVLEVWLQSAEMEKRGLAPVRISHGRGFKDMYWTFSQMIAHHTSNGCNFQSGDLIASGTVSGLEPQERGCLLELTWDGPGKPRKPIEMPSGEKRVFLADGDTVIMKAYCERDGFRRIGFGECRGKIAAAKG